MQPGESFGSYKLISRIGAGGMGEVWKAEDPRLHRVVAIKIITDSVARDAEANARFKREARTAAQLNHPNIATIYTIEEFEGREFIVMEFVDGASLAQAMRSRRPTELEVAFIGRSVAEALAEAHEKGIVHRDIKPDNIVLSGPRVKVLDFGIAKQYAFEESANATDSSRITAEFRTEHGVILGTVHYMSPEQAMGKKLDGRSDIFSLGVVLYEAATGKLPFAGETLTDTLTRIIRDDPPDLHAVRPGIPGQLADAIMRCLEKDKEKRFTSAAELARALDAFAQSAPTGRRRTAGADAAAEDQVPTVITTPKQPAPQPGAQKTEAATAVVQERQSSVPWGWILATVAIVAGSVALTGWYFAHAVANREAARLATASTSVVAPPGTVIGVQPAAPESPDTATAPMIVNELSVASAPPATAAVAPPTQPSSAPAPPAKLQGGILASDRAGAPAKALTQEATKANDAYLEGRRYLFAKQEMSAYDSFKRAVKLDPQHAPAWVSLGFIDLHEQRDGDAATDFSTALKIQDRLPRDDVQLAELGLAIATNDKETITRLCPSPRFDREFDILRRMATDRGAQNCRVMRGFPTGGGRGTRPVPVRPRP